MSRQVLSFTGCGNKTKKRFWIMQGAANAILPPLAQVKKKYILKIYSACFLSSAMDDLLQTRCGKHATKVKTHKK